VDALGAEFDPVFVVGVLMLPINVPRMTYIVSL
jgi:hypothetical protein